MAGKPHLNEELQLTHDKEQLHLRAKKLVCRLLPEWNGLQPAEIKASHISGGITNVLLKLQPTADGGSSFSTATSNASGAAEQPDGAASTADEAASNVLHRPANAEPRAAETQQQPCSTRQATGAPGPVALRVFGDKTETLIDRHRELGVLHQLNAAGFGAPVVGTFDNGRVEEFIPFRPLEPEEMSRPKIAQRIARRLAQLHAVQIEGDKPHQPEIFDRLREWLRAARDLKLPDEARQRRFEAIDLAALEAEVADVEAACDRTASPVVWSHNDLLAGNILVPTQERDPSAVEATEGDPMQFIDFEYSCHMHRGFDWGNHFNEYAGFDCDYSLYPSADQADTFLRSYLTEANGASPAEGDLRCAAAEADVFALASHQFWGTWALFQAAFSAIDFDYLEYSELRWNEYRRRKAAVLAAVDDVFGRQ